MSAAWRRVLEHVPFVAIRNLWWESPLHNLNLVLLFSVVMRIDVVCDHGHERSRWPERAGLDVMTQLGHWSYQLHCSNLCQKIMSVRGEIYMSNGQGIKLLELIQSISCHGHHYSQSNLDTNLISNLPSPLHNRGVRW